MPNQERESIARELDPPFSVHRPTRISVPILFCSPHSGRVYPTALLQRSKLDAAALRKSEDCFVDELFGCAVDCGAPLIAARFPRAYIDVNREPYELDPELFDEPLPDFANTRTLRVIGGLGTIARIVSENQQIYNSRLPLSAAYVRIEKLYKPFHAAIAQLLDELTETFGYAVLIDCHSMPTGIVQKSGASRPDFVIGDRFGSSCDASITRVMRQQIARLGYRVHLNRPYAGGYITEHYGRPFADRHSIQIEVNRGLYLDEATFTKTTEFDRLRANVARLVAEISVRIPSLFASRMAAE